MRYSYFLNSYLLLFQLRTTARSPAADLKMNQDELNTEGTYVGQGISTGKIPEYSQVFICFEKFVSMISQPSFRHLDKEFVL